MKLELVCPNVYKQFCSGNFVVQKTINPFSAIALDQTSNENKGKHHEDYIEFQKTFFNDTQKLFFCFNEIRNPFEENRLVVLDTGDVMNSDVETCLANLFERNEERYKEFYKHHLVICDISVTDTIKTYKITYLV